jgi:hypothetical protein
MKQFLKRLMYFALIGIIPIVSLLSLYFYYDPFKVLRNYHDYSYPYVIPNRDYISTTMFIKNHEFHAYNSFIFGSSRTIAFRTNSWCKYLSENSNPFLFDASGESVYGIYTKLKYLDSINIRMKNVLIILCRDVSFSHSENPEDHLTIKHPATSRESNMNFQFVFIKAFFNPDFLFRFLTYEIIGEYKPYMSGYIENRKITFDTITNETTIIDQETEISQNPSEYYLKRENLFYERKGEQIDSVQRINDKKLSMLKEVKRILEENKTNYKVVISPLYEQVKFSKSDISILRALFGDHLFDFSGRNKFTESKTNYYEPSHFRPAVGDSILYMIYK